MPLPIQRCTKSGCTWEDTKVTMDADWRWIHSTEGFSNCYTGEGWNASVCSDSAACASNCALEGITEKDWSKAYGVSRTADNAGLRLNFKTGSNVGSRMYMMDTDSTYKLFELNNREITFDVDVSTLACGLNGAVYFSEMTADGDTGGTNRAGAAYGTGYCDAQCPPDIKFIQGEANSEGWHATASGRTFGKYGSCCAEMDIWEANRVDTAYTAHPCTEGKIHRCTGDECNAQCDKSGCDFNSYRLGDRKFLGPGSEYTLDSSKPFTIVTQFITKDGTDTGDLSEIRRFYVQDGKRIENSKATFEGLDNHTSLTDAACAADKKFFGDEDTFAQYGGLKQMGKSLEKGRGMTLVLSLWDDADDHMKWLDSTEPAGSLRPGAARGPCSASSGVPADVRSKHSDAWVEYSNFKYGEIGSTTSPKAAKQLPKQSPPVVAAPIPSTSSSTGTGSCCWPGCGSDNCKASGYCSESPGHCEGDCGGEWCPISLAARVGKVRTHKHRSLRGENVFFQLAQSFKSRKAGRSSLKQEKQDASDEL